MTWKRVDGTFRVTQRILAYLPASFLILLTTCGPPPEPVEPPSPPSDGPEGPQHQVGQDAGSGCVLVLEDTDQAKVKSGEWQLPWLWELPELSDLDPFEGTSNPTLSQVLSGPPVSVSEMEKMIEASPDDDIQKPLMIHKLTAVLLERLREHASHVLQGKNKPHEEQAIEALQARAEWLKILVEDFPDYQQRDIAMFELALADLMLAASCPQEAEQRTERAQELFHALAEDFNLSRYVPYAMVAMADQMYAAEDPDSLQAALDLYVGIQKYADTSIVPYAMYKEAWCLIKLDDIEAGESRLGDVIRYFEDHPDNALASSLGPHVEQELGEDATQTD